MENPRFARYKNDIQNVAYNSDIIKSSPEKRKTVLKQTLELNFINQKKSSSLKWGSVNVVLFAILIYDLNFKCPYYTTFIHYIEYLLTFIFGLNTLYHSLRYIYYTFTTKPVVITPSQRTLLGFKDNDTTYKIQNPPSKQPMVKESSPTAPLNLSRSSWLGNSTVNDSLNQSVNSPSWVYTRGSPSMPNYQPRYMSFSDADSISDEQALQEYLRSVEESEKNAAITNNTENSPQEQNIFWNHPSIRGTNDLSPMLRKAQYQLAPLNSEIPHQLGVNEEGSPKSPSGSSSIWSHLLVDAQRLTKWNANLRKWISATVLERVVKEIKVIDDNCLRLGLTDIRIGHIGLDLLKRTAQTLQIVNHIPTMSILVPFMEICNNQEYLVQRIKELSSGGSMSHFKWNGGGKIHGKSWDETLPTDSAIIMHFFATYLDTQLLPVTQSSYPEGLPFTSQHFCKFPDKPNKTSHSLIIHQTSINPPHYVLIIGEETRDIPKGRNNLIHTLLLFLHTVATKHHGMLGRVNLGKSGVNVLWLVDQ